MASGDILPVSWASPHQQLRHSFSCLEVKMLVRNNVKLKDTKKRKYWCLTKKEKTGEIVFASCNFFIGHQTVGAVSRQVAFFEVKRLLCGKKKLCVCVRLFEWRFRIPKSLFITHQLTLCCFQKSRCILAWNTGHICEGKNKVIYKYNVINEADIQKLLQPCIQFCTRSFYHATLASLSLFWCVETQVLQSKRFLHESTKLFARKYT